MRLRLTLLTLLLALLLLGTIDGGRRRIPPPQTAGDGLPLWIWGRDEFFYPAPARALIFEEFVDLGIDVSEWKGPSTEALWIAAGGNPPTQPETFVYALDFALCEYVDCGTATMPPATPTDTSGIPEDHFLHLASDVTITFRPRDYPVAGATDGGDVTYSITGCPSPAAIAPSCRMRLGQWNGTHYVLNLGDAEASTWNANRMLSLVQSRDAQALFMDAHAPNFATLYQTNTGSLTPNVNTITSPSCSPGPCGLIREYGETYGIEDIQDVTGPPGSTFHAAWLTDQTDSLTEMRTLFLANGLWQTINGAGYNPESTSMNAQVLAAGGTVAEGVFTPNLYRFLYAGAGVTSATDPATYQGWLKLIDDITQLERGSVDFSSPVCFDCEAHPYGLGGPAGNYNTASERALATRFVMFQILREVAGRPGKVYFDPSFWALDASNEQFAEGDLSFITKAWLPNYFVDIAHSATKATVVQSGTAPDTCSTPGWGYAIWRRTLGDGSIAVLRPMDGADCDLEYGAPSAVTYSLGGTFRLKRADGTLGSPVTSITLQNAEGVIMVP